MRVLKNARLADGRMADIHVNTVTGTIAAVIEIDEIEPYSATGVNESPHHPGYAIAAGMSESAEEASARDASGTKGGASSRATTEAINVSQEGGGELLIEDLGGWLILPAMAEPHAHLDKALTAEEVPNPTGDLQGAIDGWNSAASAGKITYELTVKRATRAMELLLVHGVSSVRTHVNVMPSIGAMNVNAIREAADNLAAPIDVQIVALTGSPMTGPGSAKNRQALEAAIETGVDLVGGCPHLEPDPVAHIALVLDLAEDAKIDVDLHVDETLDPSMLSLRELARQVMSTGFGGTVTASHCVSLGMQPTSVQASVAAEVARAGISVVTLPHTNLFLQGRDVAVATPRGLTAIRALQDAGVTVAAGADNVQDPFNLVGRSDPLETAALLVMAGHLSPEMAGAMVSNASRQVLGLPPVNLNPGDPADLIAIDAPSLRGAIADAPMSRRLYRHGVLVASATQTTTLHPTTND